MGVYCLLGECNSFFYSERIRQPLEGFEDRRDMILSFNKTLPAGVLRKVDRRETGISHDAMAIIQDGSHRRGPVPAVDMVGSG